MKVNDSPTRKIHRQLGIKVEKKEEIWKTLNECLKGKDRLKGQQK